MVVYLCVLPWGCGSTEQALSCPPDFCANGGTCVEDGSSFACDCAAGFTGDHCDTNIDDCASDPCQNGGTCVDGVDSFTCDCVGAWEGETCEDCAGPVDHTVSFIDQPAQTAATIDFGDFSITGSADAVLASGGLSILGGTANLRIDGDEYISFSFDGPVTQVSYIVNEVSDYDADTVEGEATIEGFAPDGESLGSPTPVSGLGSKDVSAAVGGQRLQEFIIRASTDGHRLESLTYRGCF